MLSILIPTYNYDCAELVSELHKQAEAAHIVFEITVADDCSTIQLPNLNALSELKNFRLIKSEKNIGRAKIRNFLADNARYENLLFIDSDSMPEKSNYLSTYIQLIPERKVLLGGRVYRKPQDPKHTLLPKYGQKERNSNGTVLSTTTFTSPNFLIPKNIFNRIKFNEALRGYGHEDTLFGIDLQRQGIRFYKTDNPVIHLQIEDNCTFLAKTREAVEHLYRIHQSGTYPELDKISPLLRTFSKSKSLRIIKPLSHIYAISAYIFEKQLCSTTPSIFLFSIYKLLYICHISNNY